LFATQLKICRKNGRRNSPSTTTNNELWSLEESLLFHAAAAEEEEEWHRCAASHLHILRNSRPVGSVSCEA